MAENLFNTEDLPAPRKSSRPCANCGKMLKRPYNAQKHCKDCVNKLRVERARLRWLNITKPKYIRKADRK